jgi:hypothetical protein
MDQNEVLKREILAIISEARLSSGLSVEEISASTGLPIERVMKALNAPLTAPGCEMMPILEQLKIRDKIARMIPIQGGFFTPEGA